MAWKHNISQPSLHRLHERLMDEGILNEPDWEFRVMESGLLSSDNNGSTDNDWLFFVIDMYSTSLGRLGICNLYILYMSRCRLAYSHLTARLVV